MSVWTAILAMAALALALTCLYLRRRLKDATRRLAERVEQLSDSLESRSQAADEEKRRLFAILESMTEGVMVVDTAEKVLLANPALERHFQLRRGEVVGHFFWEVFRDADINETIRCSLAERVAIRKEHSSTMSSSVFEIQASPVSASGEFIGVAAVFRDVTVFKEYERLRSEFVANVSHELKTPLTSILGFVETLKDGSVEAEDRKGFLEIIEGHAKHLHDLIEDLLYLSRIESMHEPLRLEEVDVQRLFEKMRETFMPKLKEMRLELRVVPPPAPLKFKAEKASIERALCNLVDNAIKYNRPGGSVTLEAVPNGASTTLQVRDTGAGIAPLEQSRVFERFYRVEKSRAKGTGGTGLGLSIAKHVAERHGGRIDVQSKVGAGSTFSIVLPR